MHRPDPDPDFKISIGDRDHQAPIQFCPFHEQILHDTLVEAKFSPIVSMDSPFIRAFHVLTQMATKTLGTVEVCKFQCPVCALTQFDYIKNVVRIMLPGEETLDG